LHPSTPLYSIVYEKTTDATAIVGMVVSLVNFVFVIILFFWARLDRRREFQNERNSKWFRELILNLKLSQIESFYTSVSRLVVVSATQLTQATDDDSRRRIVEQTLTVNVGNLIEKFSDDFVDLIKIFSNDLFRDLRSSLFKVQDDLSLEYNRILNGDITRANRLNGIVQDNRVEFYRSLYLFDSNFDN
jgi:hypothetical protein